MTDRINHYMTAEAALEEAMRRGLFGAWRWFRKAQAHATLALVEQQRIANLVSLGRLQIASGLNEIGDIVGDGSAFRALYPEGPNTPLATDIAAALGIKEDE